MGKSTFVAVNALRSEHDKVNNRRIAEAKNRIGFIGIIYAIFMQIYKKKREDVSVALS